MNRDTEESGTVKAVVGEILVALILAAVSLLVIAEWFIDRYNGKQGLGGRNHGVHGEDRT